MLYTSDDLVLNQKRIRHETMVFFMGAIPFLLLTILGFAIRNRIVACGSLFLMFSEMIFLFDLRVAPLRRYNRFLCEIKEGISHDTRGVLVRIGDIPVFHEGVYFREIVINIYKDRAEDGERRFFLDCAKEMPDFQVDDYVTIRSHGVYILSISPLDINETKG